MASGGGGLLARLRRRIERDTADRRTVVDAPSPHVFASEDEVMAQLLSKKRDIETSVVDEAMARRFMDRVIGQWQGLGEADPFWSNDTQDQFRRENLSEATIAEFYAEGEGVLSFIEAFESRSEVSVGNGVCLELGCGVGKHTHALAKRFSHVLGIDVSGAGLAVCDRHMRAFGLGNVTTMRLTAPAELATRGPIDVFFCLSVLQHNPPPIQKQLIDSALKSLRPGGFCLFQTPDTCGDYRFSVAQFLTAEDAMLDIHCLPKTEVLKVLEDNEMRLLDFAPDAMLGRFGSYTYFACKA